MKLFLSALLIAVLTLAPGLARAADNVVGVILDVEGTGKVTVADGTSVDAMVKMRLHPQDVVTTGPNSRLYIQFIDNTEFTLSENAQFTVEEYNFNEADKSKNYATYSVLQGAFLYVSGLVAKRDNPDVKINIPQGSIGIRGTKFWGGMVDGAYGVIVGEGKVTVRNQAGSATLIKGQGTTLKDRITKPGAPKKWSPEKIAAATATVSLKDTVVIGQRMAEARAEQPVLRVEHEEAQEHVKRIDPVVLEKRVEEKMIALHPEMRPDLLKPEEKTDVQAPASTTTNTDTKTDNTLKQRLEQERVNSVDQDTLLKRLNNTDATVSKTVTETVIPATRDVTAPVVTKVAPAGTDTTTEVIKRTTDAATDTGARAVTTTVQTTKAVKDTATDTVKTTTETVKQVIETPVLKDTTSTPVEKSTEPASQPLEDKVVSPTVNAVTNTLSSVKDTTDNTVIRPAANAIKELKAKALTHTKTQE